MHLIQFGLQEIGQIMLKNNHDKIRELAKEEPILRSVLNMVEYGHPPVRNIFRSNSICVKSGY